MREFGIIHVGYWEWCTRKQVSDTARSLGAYLLSNRHGNSLGCYRLPREYVSADMGYSVDRVSRGCRELEKHGLIYFCNETKFLFLRKFLKYNPPQNNSHAKGVLKCAKSIPEDFSGWTGLRKAMHAYLPGKLDELGKKLLADTLSTQCGRPDIDADLGDDTPCRHTDTDTDTETDTHTDGGRGNDEDFPREIADAFAQILPELVPPRGIRLTPDLRKQIQARCSELAERRDIDWWRGYFQDVRGCPHLMGENTSGWQASISWMTKPRNMTKVLAGEYRRSARAKNTKPLDRGLMEKDYTQGAERWDQGSVQ